MNETEAYEYCNGAITLKNKVETAFMEMARYLFKIRNERLWESAGYDSFESFGDELRISQGTVSKLINIYQKYVLEYGFTEQDLAKAGGWSVLAETLPLIGSRIDAEHWLGLATTLSLRDMRKEALEAKMGVITTSTTTTCEHNHIQVIERCQTCGFVKNVTKKET